MKTETQVKNMVAKRVEDLIKAEGSNEIQKLQVEIKLLKEVLSE